jgi:hypothetical protein
MSLPRRTPASQMISTSPELVCHWGNQVEGDRGTVQLASAVVGQRDRINTGICGEARRRAIVWMPFTTIGRSHTDRSHPMSSQLSDHPTQQLAHLHSGETRRSLRRRGRVASPARGLQLRSADVGR